MLFPFLLLFSAWGLRAFVVNHQRYITSTPESQKVQLCAFNKPSTELLMLQLQDPKPCLKLCLAELISAMPQDAFPKYPLQEREEPACLAWLRGSAGFASPHPTVQMPQPQRGLQAHPRALLVVQNPPHVGGLTTKKKLGSVLQYFEKRNENKHHF